MEGSVNQARSINVPSGSGAMRWTAAGRDSPPSCAPKCAMLLGVCMNGVGAKGQDEGQHLISPRLSRRRRRSEDFSDFDKPY
eukprot:4282110-Amphidinium_carterae.1